MMQEVNNENSFEFIEKSKNESQNYDPNLAPKQLPESSLSSIPPPSALPSFITPVEQPSSFTPATPIMMPVSPINTAKYTPSVTMPSAPTTASTQQVSEQFYPTTFSPAIPPSKGTALGTSTLPSPNNSIEMTSIDISEQSDGGLFNWMKGAVSSSGGILSKVAEKAKSSVGTMITTLDPQMREFIYSGGDINIIVASEAESKVSPIREAFQNVFGKATVSGLHAQASNIAAQPVGFQSGIAAAKERIASIHTNPKTLQVPTVAVENFIVELDEDMWYDLGVLILNDPSRGIVLQTFTQMTPIPSAIVILCQKETPADYALKSSGFSVPIGGLLAENLSVDKSGWHEALTGVSRRSIILSAAKALAGMYKNRMTL